ncbi:MAG: SAM-dependent methyltransferase [Phenylobacterium sp.]|uniref:class I SAM-dependent methyltransferase n=1 Tax=Phenylobacterium sp. TaxID=1871053 RepID=UPI0011FC4419|nr:class I SAM-dependent methyltransferase [Phenylobacterium sp.]TAL28538.1 MAG: SAM-dependent methyltransferase [Phenylobacterium sp.]
MKLLAYLLYIPLQIVWLPLSLLGVILVGLGQVGVSRRLGVSWTAVEVLNARWTMDVFGLRRDKAARRLAGHIPNDSTFGLWLFCLPLWLTRWVCRTPFLYPVVSPPERTGVAGMVVMRTLAIDDAIAHSLEGAEQFVFLGAGLDTRAYGPLLNRDLAIYELDRPADLALKREGLKAAGIDVARVRYVEVDFADPNWLDALRAAGYDQTRKTIFLWEGVTLYLTTRQVRDTLEAIRAHMAPTSVVIADFYATRTLEWGSKATAGYMEKSGEGLRFGIDFSADPEARLQSFLRESKLRLAGCTLLGGADKRGPLLAIAELTP